MAQSQSKSQSQSQELLGLLSVVAPEFRKLASFFTGNSKIAILTRQRLDKEPFYTKLHVEFNSLANTLRLWDMQTEIPDSVEHTLLRALDGLESRFVKTRDSNFSSRPLSAGTKYPRLQDLRCRIDVARNENSHLTVEDLGEIIHLADKRKEYRTHMVSRLTQCNKELEQLARRAAPDQRRYTFHSKETKTPVQSGLSGLPSSHIRDHASLLYRILAKNWNCNGHSPHTATKLRLSTHRSESSETRFEMVFCNASSGSCKWQESDVRFIPRNRHKQPAAAAFRPTNAKSVTFSLSTKESPRPLVMMEKKWRVEGMCKLIETVATRTSCRLKLLVEDEELWHLSPSSTTEDIRKKDPVSLGEFLNLKSLFRFERVKRREKLILQVILANGLLHFYQGPWLSKDWNKSQICFYQSQNQLIPDLTRPYLSTQCMPFEQAVVKDDLRYQVHPYPGILAFGILLLEIELGRPIERERPIDSPNNDEVFYIDADRPVAMGMLEQCRDDSPMDFVSAVEACLDVNTFTDIFGQDGSYEDPTFRQKIFELIVKPLEEALQKVFGIAVEKLDTLPSTVPSVLNGPYHYRQLCYHPAQMILQTESLLNLESSKNVAVTQTRSESEPQVCLYDDSEKRGAVSEQISRCVDNWFTELHDRVHPLIQREPSHYRQPLCCKVFPRPGRVRMAILDTGIELPEKEEWAYGDRIMDRKSWLVSDEICDKDFKRGDRDLDGHGTHAAALFLRVAPEADLFIARVFKDRNETKGSVLAEVIHQRIADAIMHAVKEWEVDIISMSFGFEQSVQVIDEAIRFADDKKVIMLAAASNQGGNSNIAWPARHPQVICIYATDHFGNRCDFTPTENPRDYNFAVLGQAVNSSWPPHLGYGNEVRKSGTSTATPIAAGIAAIVLEYVKFISLSLDHELSKEKATILSKIRSSAGMSTVFLRMAKRNRAGYDYIVPWDFLNKMKYRDSSVWDIISGDLRDL